MHVKRPRPKALRALRFIAETVWACGKPPSIREFQAHHRANVDRSNGLLLELMDLGLIQFVDEYRGIRITDKGLSVFAWAPPVYMQRKA